MQKLTEENKTLKCQSLEQQKKLTNDIINNYGYTSIPITNKRFNKKKSIEDNMKKITHQAYNATNINKQNKEKNASLKALQRANSSKMPSYGN